MNTHTEYNKLKSIKGQEKCERTVQHKHLFTFITSTVAELRLLEAFWDQVSVKLSGF